MLQGGLGRKVYWHNARQHIRDKRGLFGERIGKRVPIFRKQGLCRFWIRKAGALQDISEKEKETQRQKRQTDVQFSGKGVRNEKKLDGEADKENLLVSWNSFLICSYFPPIRRIY